MEFGIKHSLEYISSLWRNKIPKIIASYAEDQFLNYYYLNEEKGKYTFTAEEIFSRGGRNFHALPERCQSVRSETSAGPGKNVCTLQEFSPDETTVSSRENNSFIRWKK